MGDISLIVGVLVSVMGSVRDYLSVGNCVATQFVCNDLPGLSTIASQQSSEETFGCIAIPTLLKIHIPHLPILVDCPP
jgi:hypothetical protein